VTLKEQKNCIWGAIHPSRQQELTHIRPRTAAFIQDSLPEYIARITSVFEPEIFSEKYRQAYQNRKQSKQETATRYLASKWFHYTRAEPSLNWPNFVRDTINGLVCFKLKSRLYQKLEDLRDMGKFQAALYKEIMLIRRDIQDPAGSGGSLAGLKVTQYETNAVEEPDMDYGTEDLKVAVMESRNECFNCGRTGHIKRQCTQPQQQDAEQTVVYSNTKILHSNSPNISSKNSKFSKIDKRVNDNKENKTNKINNNKINKETETPKQRRAKEKLRGPTKLIIQAKNETRQPRKNKQNLRDQDLGIKIRPKQRSRGNRSGNNNYVGQAGVVSNQGEIKEFK
jgi:hypothetical protein